MPAQLILQLQQADGSFSCEQYDQFPAPSSGYIAICFTDTPTAGQMAADLKQAFVRAILNIGAILGQAPCNSHAVPFSGCMALGVHENTKLLIVVTDGLSNNFAEPAVLHWGYDILPVVPGGQNVKLPTPFNVPNAVFWKAGIDEVVPTLFGLTGISEADQRIFISYRRTDASELAIQLFDRLSHEGFEVFLDRFSINPGVNFQNRLYQELADKAMVLMVESPEYLDSEWVQYEIDFAKKYRLGLYAVNIDSSPKVPSIDNEIRHPVTLNANGQLDPAALDRLVLLIRQQHALAIYRMRNYLNANILLALQDKGASPVTDHNGFIVVNSHSIWTTPRPPIVSDYHHSDISNNQGSRMIMFGPEFMEKKREVINSWLCGKTAIDFYNEGQLLELRNRIYP